MQRYVTTAIVGAIVLGVAAQAHGVLFTFDDPAELDRWEVRTERAELGGDAAWRIEDGLLAVTSNGWRYVGVRVVRGLQLVDGSVSFRVRFASAETPVHAQVGVVFRLQSEPKPHGYPGQYVFLDSLNKTVSWQDRQLWAWDLPDPNGAPNVHREATISGGLSAGLGRWNDLTMASWLDVRIGVHEDGSHGVSAKVDGVWREEISAQDVLAGNLVFPPLDDLEEFEQGGPRWAVSIEELVSEGDPRFGVGDVGIYMMLWPNGGGEARIEIDDFEVQGALAIPDKTSLATTWAQLKL